MYISSVLVFICLSLLIVLTIVSLSLFFKLKDLLKEYHEGLRNAERSGFKQAMNLKLNDSDAFHIGYLKALNDIRKADKSIVKEQFTASAAELEKKLEGGNK